jgi:proteasome lid subunit RPN8/RPN11
MSLQPKILEFTSETWHTLLGELRCRGNGERESGAFLLGTGSDGVNTVQRILPYDELDRESLKYDYVRLGSDAFCRLWDACARQGLEVVADVHTHPGLPFQSSSDRAHPMISMPGHIALIVPGFALGHVNPSDLSVNVYVGSGRWNSYFDDEAAALIRILGNGHHGS